MSNLIVTIISIAIIAIAAIMAIYYGGAAYNSAQVNAAANAMVNNATQIANALRAWSATNGGDTSTFPPPQSSGCTPDAKNILVTGGYLTSMPGQSFSSSIYAGFNPGTFTPGTWDLVRSDYTPKSCTPYNALVTTFGTAALLISSGWPSSGVPNGAALCKAINAMQGITSPPTASTFNYGFISAMGSAQFACEQDTTAGIYYFVYHIF